MLALAISPAPEWSERWMVCLLSAEAIACILGPHVSPIAEQPASKERTAASSEAFRAHPAP